MKFQYLRSATVIVEAAGKRILMDPWLLDGEYYGAWAQWPPFDWDGADVKALDGIDYIYVSHIHPDHMSRETMKRLRKDVPVLIHGYAAPFLRKNIEAIGFEVRELPHNVETELAPGLRINILAADDCDPELCGRMMGCTLGAPKLGSTQIDSLCVVSDGRSTLVNTNDCPFAMAQQALGKVKSHYGDIDMLLVGYSGAGEYPQCFPDLGRQERELAEKKKRTEFLRQAECTVRALAPRYALPFAGQYTLCGRLAELDDNRGVPELDEARAHLAKAVPDTECIALNPGATFDVTSGEADAEYVPVDVAAKRAYRDTVLATRRLDYEADPAPSISELEALGREAMARFGAKRRELGIKPGPYLHVDLAPDRAIWAGQISDCIDFINPKFSEAQSSYVRLTTDPRLLMRLFKGPAHAHWNNACIGSHVQFRRYPDVYDRGLGHAMNWLHA